MDSDRPSPAQAASSPDAGRPANSSFNPYAAPPQPGEQVAPFQWDGWSVRRIGGGWLWRRFSISGRCDAIVQYDARGLGYEQVLVDGVVAARIFSRGLWLTRSIEFELSGERSPHRARLEIHTSWLYTLGGVRMEIDGQVVYAEGRFAGPTPGGA